MKFKSSSMLWPTLKVVAGLFILGFFVYSTTRPAYALPISWGSVTSLFTDAQDNWMAMIAVVGCFTFIGGILTVAISQNLGGLAIGLFVTTIVCVLMLAGPSVISWIQTLFKTTTAIIIVPALFYGG